ncbi:helix-turn-helix transcriptional regulator [Kordia sp. YSTF-M3]|uniref:Helix-turn-helix transcriptional regulator n=1 Tax=Kordia aestuariivivens TaxID=2759037 RepID=A0ABR7Q5E1_9FLAO|nr:helix-turn-helix domain-containing protein [Kordia aestuariivivens]MBC8753559.1 helix-turn-helix transcriptional regulator [Kordia aestuariivivens]
MGNYRLFLILISLLVFSNSSAQENTLVIDSILKGKNHADLKSIFYNSFDKGDLTKANIIANYTLSKARKDKDTVAIINSYIRLCRSNQRGLENGLSDIDSCIVLSKMIDNLNLEAEGYFFKAQLFKDHKLYDDALKYYIKSDELYTILDDEKSYMSVRHIIGMLKLRVGNHEDALKIIKESFAYEKENINEENNKLSYIISLHDLSIVYVANGMNDLASIANEEGYLLARENERFNELYFTQLEGGNHFYRNNYSASKDSLLKTIPFLREKKDINLSIVYFFLGRISEINNNTDKAISYFKKVDSIYTNTEYVLNKPRSAYESLIKYYKKKNNLKEQLYYLNRLLKVDSILDLEHKGLLNTFHKEYDTPKLIEEKKEIIDALGRKNNSYKYIILLVIIFSIILLIVTLLIINRKKKNEQRYLEIISSLEQQNKDPKNAIKKTNNESLGIDKEIIDIVLKGLDIFEREKGYLAPKLTLNDLAKRIEINSRYVSKVINHEKNKNVQNYINDLRVDYAIHKLQNDKKFRNYTIKAIAEEVGFTNTESFTKAFRKKTTLNVSYFIKKINN